MILQNARIQAEIWDIRLENGRIHSLGHGLTGDVYVNARGRRVIPGLVDLHIHGFGGLSVNTPGTLNAISCRLAQQGTTTFLPTTMSDSDEALRLLTAQSLAVKGAAIPGFHLEGPYLSPAKKGAQNESYLRAPLLSEFRRYAQVSRVTLAPELPGALSFIREAGCHVSLGHTACDRDTACAAFDAGADCLTHTFNAMPPFLHRAPGPIGAALEKDGYVEVICDGRHVDRDAVLALYRIFGSRRMILISDAIAPAGLPSGSYESGGLPVIMKDGVLTLPDGTLAGGSAPLLHGVKTAVSFGIPFDEAIRMASETPAAYLGLPRGRIEPGFDADLILLEEDFRVADVILRGRRFSLPRTLG